MKSGSFANHWAPTPKPQPLAAPSRLDSMSVICYSVLTAVLPCPKLGVLARLGSPRRCTRTQRTGPVPLSAPSTVLRSAQPPGSLPTPGPLQTLPNAGLSSNHPPGVQAPTPLLSTCPVSAGNYYQLDYRGPTSGNGHFYPQITVWFSR